MNSLSIIKKIGRLFVNCLVCVLFICLFFVFEFFVAVILARAYGSVGETLLATSLLFLIALAFFGLPKIQHKHYLLRYVKYALYITYIFPFIRYVLKPIYLVIFYDPVIPVRYWHMMTSNITAHILAYLVVWYGVKRQQVLTTK